MTLKPNQPKEKGLRGTWWNKGEDCHQRESGMTDGRTEMLCVCVSVCESVCVCVCVCV